MSSPTLPCVTCRRVIPSEFLHCNFCGSSQDEGHTQAFASGYQGIAIAGQRGSIHISQASGWDTRTPVEHDKGGARLIGKGLEIGANVAALLSLALTFGTASTLSSTGLPLALVAVMGLVTVGLGAVTLTLVRARTAGYAVVRVKSLVLGVLRLREDNRRLEWIKPRITCPFCPPQSSRGVMSLQHFGEQTWWICKANTKLHRLTFDGTQYVD